MTNVITVKYLVNLTERFFSRILRVRNCTVQLKFAVWKIRLVVLKTGLGHESGIRTRVHFLLLLDLVSGALVSSPFTSSLPRSIEAN